MYILLIRRLYICNIVSNFSTYVELFFGPSMCQILFTTFDFRLKIKKVESWGQLSTFDFKSKVASANRSNFHFRLRTLSDFLPYKIGQSRKLRGKSRKLRVISPKINFRLSTFDTIGNSLRPDTKVKVKSQMCWSRPRNEHLTFDFFSYFIVYKSKNKKNTQMSKNLSYVSTPDNGQKLKTEIKHQKVALN